MKTKNNDKMIAVELESDSDEHVAHYRFDGSGRLILDTVHGCVIIDIRYDDVNSFVIRDGIRVDKLLINNK